MQAIILGAIARHALAALGVYLTTKGYLTGEQASQAGDVLAQLGGPAAALGALAWSIVQKVRTRSLR